jgi:hypothetical protein
MTTIHNNDEIHISMLAERQEDLVENDKLIISDSANQKTRNVRLAEFRCKAVCPYKIEKFIISEAQILASSYGNPIFLLPILGVEEYYTFMGMWINTFKNVVTNPANPLSAAVFQQLSFRGWCGNLLSPGGDVFLPLTQPQFTSATDQLVRLKPEPYITDINFQQSLSCYSSLILIPNFGAGVGWITGEGYWEIEIMYKKNEAY